MRKWSSLSSYSVKTMMLKFLKRPEKVLKRLDVHGKEKK